VLAIILKNFPFADIIMILFISEYWNSEETMKTRKDLAHTYSIIAIDLESGEMGGAVQSHYFSVGSTVIWAEAGVGVVATQAMVNFDFGPLGLTLLREGKNAKETLNKLVSNDEGARYRQAAVLDCSGGVDAFTGGKTIREAGQIMGPGYSCQANMMMKDTVWAAMAKGFSTATGSLAHRLLVALEAAETEGGDIRGRQSAAIKVVSLEDKGKVRENLKLDLRVEDSDEPLVELRRLLTIHGAYTHADLGDLAVEEGDFNRALQEYAKAEEALPHNLELRFWKGVSLLNNHLFDEASSIFKSIFSLDDNWRELLTRLPDAEVVSGDPEVTAFISKLTEETA